MRKSNEAPQAPRPAWQRLTRIVVPGGAVSESRVAGLVVEVVRDLKLPPAPAQLIHDAVADAVRQITLRPGAPQRAPAIAITVFLSGRRTRPAPGQALERQGWGCFVIRHLVDGARAAAADAHYQIELYLYREGGDTPD